MTNQKIEQGIVSINVDKLVAVLTTAYGIRATSNFARVNLDLGATSLPSYQGKAWLIDGEQVANLSIPKGLLRETATKAEYALNLTFGVIRAMLDAKSRDYDKADVLTAFEAVNIQVHKRDSGQRYLSGAVPADILDAIDTPPIYRPKKTHGTRQVKCTCSCGQSIYIADKQDRPAITAARSIICDLCLSNFAGEYAERIEAPQAELMI